jgi:hypothetical protein
MLLGVRTNLHLGGGHAISTTEGSVRATETVASAGIRVATHLVVANGVGWRDSPETSSAKAAAAMD